MLVPYAEDPNSGLRDKVHDFCKELLEGYIKSVCTEVEGVTHKPDIELDIWHAVQGNPEAMEYYRIDERDVLLLNTIANKMGGWLRPSIIVTRDNEKVRSYDYISLPSWEKRYQGWITKNQQR